MKVYELLDSPDKLIVGSFAKAANGDTVSSYSEEAVCWCIV